MRNFTQYQLSKEYLFLFADSLRTLSLNEYDVSLLTFAPSLKTVTFFILPCMWDRKCSRNFPFVFEKSSKLPGINFLSTNAHLHLQIKRIQL